MKLKNQKIRLLGINAPEVRGPERDQGLISKRHLSDLILGKSVIIKTYKNKKGKYGRWLGIVCYGQINVNAWMVRKGLADGTE